MPVTVLRSRLSSHIVCDLQRLSLSALREIHWDSEPGKHTVPVVQDALGLKAVVDLMSGSPAVVNRDAELG